MPEWLPIDSAPKNGGDVLVYYEFATVPIVHIAWWRSEADLETMEDARSEDIGWWSYVENSVSQHKLDGYHSPTHWLPLPPSPKRG